MPFLCKIYLFSAYQTSVYMSIEMRYAASLFSQFTFWTVIFSLRFQISFQKVSNAPVSLLHVVLKTFILNMKTEIIFSLQFEYFK